MSKFRFVKEHRGLDGEAWSTERFEPRNKSPLDKTWPENEGIWIYVPGSTATTEEQGRRLFEAAQKSDYSKHVIAEADTEEGDLFSEKNDERFEHRPNYTLGEYETDAERNA